MTTIKIKAAGTAVVNGRNVWKTISFQEINKISNGAWEGITECGNAFRIVGGLESGGARNEWFLEYPLGFGDQAVPANSAKQCLEMMGRV